MDKEIVEELEDLLSKRWRTKDEMMGFFSGRPKYLHQLIYITLSENDPQNWRSAWIQGHFIKELKSHLEDFLPQLVDSIPGKRDGHQREIIRLLKPFDLNEELEGKTFDYCTQIWEDVSKSPSSRFVAMDFILTVCEKYPEIKPEVEALLDERFVETLSPGG